MRTIWLLLMLFSGPTMWAQQDAAAESAPLQETQTPAQNEDEASDPGSLPPPDYEPFQPNSEPPPELNRSDIYINTFGSLLFVLALIVIIAWAARRFLFDKLGVANKTQGRMFVVQNLPLGSRRHVSLIEVDGKRYLLGVTDHQVNLIKALDDLDFDDALSQAETEPPPTVSQLMGEES